MKVIVCRPGQRGVPHEAVITEASPHQLILKLQVDENYERVVADVSPRQHIVQFGTLIVTLTPAVPGQDPRLLTAEIPPLVHVSADSDALAKDDPTWLPVREGITWPHWDNDVLRLEVTPKASIIKAEALVVGQKVHLPANWQRPGQFTIAEIQGFHKIRVCYNTGANDLRQYLHIEERIVLAEDPTLEVVSSYFTDNWVTLASAQCSGHCAAG